MGRKAYGVKRNDNEDVIVDDEADDYYYYYFRFAEVRTNKRRGLVTHTEQSDERLHKQHNCKVQCEGSTESSKMRYTSQISYCCSNVIKYHAAEEWYCGLFTNCL